LGERKDEVSVRDVHLTPTERLRENPAFYATYHLFGIVRSGQQNGVCHARHGRAGEALASAISRETYSEMFGREPVLHVAAQHAVFDQCASLWLDSFIVHVD